jgi:hypothetical protein
MTELFSISPLAAKRQMSSKLPSRRPKRRHDKRRTKNTVASAAPHEWIFRYKSKLEGQPLGLASVFYVVALITIEVSWGHPRRSSPLR